MHGRIIAWALVVLSQSAYGLTIYKYTDANGVVTYTDQAVRGAQVFVFRDQMVEKTDHQVRLERKSQGTAEILVVHNELYAPVEVELKIEQQPTSVLYRAPLDGSFQLAVKFNWPLYLRKMPPVRCSLLRVCAMCWEIPTKPLGALPILCRGAEGPFA